MTDTIYTNGGNTTNGRFVTDQGILCYIWPLDYAPNCNETAVDCDSKSCETIEDNSLTLNSKPINISTDLKSTTTTTNPSIYDLNSTAISSRSFPYRLIPPGAFALPSIIIRRLPPIRKRLKIHRLYVSLLSQKTTQSLPLYYYTLRSLSSIGVDEIPPSYNIWKFI